MIIKSIVIILIIIIAVCSLSACNDLNEDSPSPSVNDQNEIFPYGDFFTLQEAYDLGYLTVQDLESIAYYCNGGLRWYETDDILDPWKSEPITDYEPIAKNPEILGAETENKIKQTWIYYLNDNLTIPSDVTIDYYGTHNNCVAIWLTATHYGYTQAIWYSTVAGVTFCYNNGNSIKIWVEHVSYGNFYTLQEAYDLGYLTHEDLESIAYYRNEGLRWYEADDILYPWESEPVSEDYTPIPKNPEKLDAETENKIKQTRAYDIDTNYEATADDVFISAYYGTYNGCTAIWLTDNFHDYTQAIWYSTVAGVTFCYNNGNSINIWVEN